MVYQINFRELTYALSESLDYVGIDDIMHGKRVAYIACEIAKKLGWRESKQDKILTMAMLHDCGVSSTNVHHAIISQLDWEEAQKHCDVGADLVKNIPPYADFSSVIALHHTHWTAFDSSIEEETKLYANLIFLSDRIDALRAQFGAQLMYEKAYIRSIIQQHEKVMFSSKLVEAFIELSFEDSFWYYLEPNVLHYYFLPWLDKGEITTVSFEYIRQIATMFSKIVDAKDASSSYRTGCIASLARFIATQMHMPEADIERVEIAALLHELGKLRIPDTLMLKTSPLNEEESNSIKRQGFDTQIILEQIKGFKAISELIHTYYASYLTDGEMEASLPLGVRIIHMAKMVQTILENPHKNLEHSKHHIKSLCHIYALEEEAYEGILHHLKACYEHENRPIA